MVVIGSVQFAHGTFVRRSHSKGAFRIEGPDYTFFSVLTDGHRIAPSAPSASEVAQFARGPMLIVKPNELRKDEFEEPAISESLTLTSLFVNQIVFNELSGARPLKAGSHPTRMSPVVLSLWRRLARLCENPDAGQAATAEMCAELLVLRLVEDHVSDTYNAEYLSNLEAVRRAICYIDANLSEKIDIKSIARAAGLSPFYFSRVFRATQGTTVHRFVLERRLDLAWRLLKDSPSSVSEIALETGFSSQSHMTTSFRQRYGVTPAAFHRQAVNDRD